MEHDGRFPPALLVGTDDDSTSGDVRCWDWWTRSNDPNFLQPGLLWTYTNHPDRVLQCPAYDGVDNWSGPDQPTGYNYNVTFVAAMTPMQGVAGQGSWDLLIDKPALRGPDGSPGGTDLALAQCRRPGRWHCSVKADTATGRTNPCVLPCMNSNSPMAAARRFDTVA